MSSIPEHAQGSAVKKLEDAWHQLNSRPYPRKSSDPGVAALYDELRQVDERMSERLRTLIAGQSVNRLDFHPPADFLERLHSATSVNGPASAEAHAYVDYVSELYQVLRLARLIAR
ncbi:MAG: hypothetical protein K2X03_31500 [Bryobacteraceae bacterium]|nr:hypothetical protein [Bryobacteraceae bacterium]